MYTETPLFQIGVDEVGRGSLYGCVYAAAVLQTPDIENETQIKDSKLFHSKTKINQVDAFIRNCTSYAIASRSAKEIDQINILQASQLAMHDAIRQLITKVLEKEPQCSFHILVDGNYFLPFEFIQENNMVVPITWECIVGGDRVSKSIAAASIVAKVARDAYIENICDKQPELQERFGLLQNKGYGTAMHRKGLTLYGYDENHRLSFQPIKSMVKR